MIVGKRSLTLKVSRRASSLALLTVVGFIAVYMVVAAADAESPVLSLERAFARIAKSVGPSVVHIQVARDIRGAAPPDNPPFGEGSGSGIILTKDGYILTNNHVVSGATNNIVVVLANGEELDGRVVGRDPNTDLAVIKVDPKESLSVAALGDSDTVEVGQWAIAIGSPFGLQQTVTIGIISASHRRVGILGSFGFEDFIQTDAAINPGNSGGPLVNSRGEVIGLNSLISTQTGSSSGVGFAIPINMAKGIAEILIRDGRVTRGFLGVQIRDLEPDDVSRLGLKSREGSMVAGVMAGRPADLAGIRQNDVIKSIDGVKIRNTEELRKVVATAPVGKEIEVVVIRDKREQMLKVILGEMPNQQENQ